MIVYLLFFLVCVYKPKVVILKPVQKTRRKNLVLRSGWNLNWLFPSTLNPYTHTLIIGSWVSPTPDITVFYIDK